MPVPQAPTKLTTTKEEILKLSPKNCPKCGAFVEVVFFANNEHGPGVWCNKDGCGFYAPLPADTKPLCNYACILNASLIEMLRQAPMNEELRAVIHSTMLQPVPKTCRTLDDIIHWIERAAPTCFHHVDDLDIIAPRPPRPQPGPPPFEMEMTYQYTELGHCTYSCDRSGNATYELTNETMREIVEECGSLGELVDRVKTALIQEVYDNPPDTEAGDFDYDNHECDDDENSSATVNRRHLESLLIEWMSTHMPERLDELS